MPNIEVTPEQAERLAAVQEELAAEVVGKYGHVRAQDAIEYLLDEYESGGERSGIAETAAEAAVVGEHGAADSSDAAEESGDAGDGDADDTDDADDAGAAATGGTDPGGSDGDAMLNAMMNLLDTHDDKWGESSGDERYEVTLPDGEVERVRTKDDVRALLFKHYR